MSLALGPHLLDALVTGELLADGGAVFGAVPREEWSRWQPPLEGTNTIRLVHRSLLVRTGQRVIVVGAGGEVARFEAELARLGLRRGDVTDVVLARLTSDHASALVENGALTFPAATHHVQRRHWTWAHHPSELDQARFSPATLEALESSGRLHFIEGETELFAGVSVLVSEGHTVAQQLLRVADEPRWLTYAGALLPTGAHLEPAWLSALDLYPLTTVEEKELIVAEALDDDGILFFEHDPFVAACRLREEEGALVAAEVELS